MPITPATGETTARTVDEHFLDLVCSDADLLAAEFDEIIAAEWPDPPANRPGPGATGRHPTRRAAHHGGNRVGGPVWRPQRQGVGGSARQRSPPIRKPTHDRQEGR